MKLPEAIVIVSDVLIGKNNRTPGEDAAVVLYNELRERLPRIFGYSGVYTKQMNAAEFTLDLYQKGNIPAEPALKKVVKDYTALAEYVEELEAKLASKGDTLGHMNG